MQEQLDRYWCWHFNKFRGGEESDPFIQLMEERLALLSPDQLSKPNGGKHDVVHARARAESKSQRLRMFAGDLQSSLQEAHSQNSTMVPVVD
jgi:hypothetical protein